MSHFAPNSIFPSGVLKGVQHMVLKALQAFALADLSILYGASSNVSCNRAESTGVSPVLMSWGLMKAGSDWCLFLPVGEESFEWGSTDDSLDANDAGSDYDSDLDEYIHWGDDTGDWCLLCVIFSKQHGSNVHVTGVHLEGHAFGLLAFMVLKGIAFGLFFYFSVKGLERMCHHSKLA